LSYVNQFDKELRRLFERRTMRLRKKLGEKQLGQPKKINRKYVNKTIKNMQALASKALTNSLAKKEFENSTKLIKYWKIKGHGREQKRESIEVKFDRLISSRNCVYAFFKGKQCLYVGRTHNGGSRPASHYQKFWFTSATRIKIYSVSKSEISKIECLAIHRYLPKHNKNKASTKKWTKKCPLCKIHKNIESELRQIFSFKG
jgi:hypothetical protein